jgi:addiction module RelB/DinJ family antitoxin
MANLMLRSATLQMRVPPLLKYASEQVLQRIGLSMTEAVELFLRRTIQDEKLPFEIVALDETRLAEIVQEYERQLKLMKSGAKAEKLGTAQKKNSKRFLGARAPTRIRSKTPSKRGNN